MTDEELFQEWGSAWTLREAEEKERHLRACCTDDVEFFPPDDRPVFRGIEDVLEHVLTYTADWPASSSARLARPPETHHSWSRGLMLWSRPPRLDQGTDIINIRDGKIAAMLVFSDPSPVA